jgi:hypothetical protein
MPEVDAGDWTRAFWDAGWMRTALPATAKSRFSSGCLVAPAPVDPKITEAFGPMILQLIATAADLTRALPTKAC